MVTRLHPQRAAANCAEDSLVRRGGQGSVYKSVLDGKPVAIKFIPKEKGSTIEAELTAVSQSDPRWGAAEMPCARFRRRCCLILVDDVIGRR